VVLHIASIGMAVGIAHSVLSNLHLAIARSFVSLYAHLLRVCPSGHHQAWTL
jgi:hypothetical protein